MHTVPFLVLLTAFTAAASYAHLILLRRAVRPAIIATAIFIPCAMAAAALAAFTGSFNDGSWGETIGCATP